MTIYFISDTHLHESRPEITQGFYRFLEESLDDAEALYILGDFFDMWIGDDDDSALAQEIARRLRVVSDRGIRIYLMHGNRDFLLGEAFATKAGAEILADGIVKDFYGCRTLLMHGDSLCTRDIEYQVFRQQVRSGSWQAQVLTQPLSVRRALATKMRMESQSMNSLKAEDIMDVTQEDVIRVMSENQVQRLIHGHTHRPARHSLTVNGEAAERIVLGDWHHEGWCLAVNENQWELRHWPLTE